MCPEANLSIEMVKEIERKINSGEMKEQEAVNTLNTFVKIFMDAEENKLRQIELEKIKRKEEAEKKLQELRLKKEQEEKEKQEKYKVTVEYKNGWKIIHRTPIRTEEEEELFKQEILRKMYNLFYGEKIQ